MKDDFSEREFALGRERLDGLRVASKTGDLNYALWLSLAYRRSDSDHYYSLAAHWPRLTRRDLH